jgi:hypothetical protein
MATSTDDDGSYPTVHVTVRLPAALSTAPTLRVWLEDVSFVDRAAGRIVEIQQPIPASHGGTVQITLCIPEVDKTRRYAVRAHLEMQQTGGVCRGDFISDQSYPVLTFGHASTVVVTLQQV